VSVNAVEDAGTIIHWNIRRAGDLCPILMDELSGDSGAILNPNLSPKMTTILVGVRAYPTFPRKGCPSGYEDPSLRVLHPWDGSATRLIGS
jgi:hypothetical protein